MFSYDIIGYSIMNAILSHLIPFLTSATVARKQLQLLLERQTESKRYRNSLTLLKTIFCRLKYVQLIQTYHYCQRQPQLQLITIKRRKKRRETDFKMGFVLISLPNMPDFMVVLLLITEYLSSWPKIPKNKRSA